MSIGAVAIGTVEPAELVAVVAAAVVAAAVSGRAAAAAAGAAPAGSTAGAAAGERSRAGRKLRSHWISGVAWGGAGSAA